MPRAFRTSLFGYNRRQVDKFIAAKTAEYENALALRNERFVEMRDQNNFMKVELARYRSMESEISTVLIRARATANEMMAEGEKNVLQEKERLLEEIRQLDRLAQAVYGRIENMLMQAEDCVRGFEGDLNDLITRKEIFLKSTYGFEREKKE